ncbi:MAG: hypothetical protein ACLQGJ_05760 [Candidatus Dormibacteria bacterium]
MHIPRKAGILSAGFSLTLAAGVVAASLSVAASSGAALNGFSGNAPASSKATCAILNDVGTKVTSVAIDQLLGSDQVYWLQYEPKAGATSVTFTVTPSSSSDPLRSITQKFTTVGGVNTPFGIPYWGGDLTTGSYKLVGTDNAGGKATCKFTAS